MSPMPMPTRSQATRREPRRSIRARRGGTSPSQHPVTTPKNASGRANPPPGSMARRDPRQGGSACQREPTDGTFGILDTRTGRAARESGGAAELPLGVTVLSFGERRTARRAFGASGSRRYCAPWSRDIGARYRRRWVVSRRAPLDRTACHAPSTRLPRISTSSREHARGWWQWAP